MIPEFILLVNIQQDYIFAIHRMKLLIMCNTIVTKAINDKKDCICNLMMSNLKTGKTR